MSKKKWPKKKAEVVSIEDITEPLRKFLEETHTVTPKKLKTLPTWTGFPDTGPTGAACAHTKIAEILSPASLEHNKNQGRDLLDLIILIAVRMGLEQGRRYERYENKQGGLGTTKLYADILSAELGKPKASDGKFSAAKLAQMISERLAEVVDAD